MIELLYKKKIIRDFLSLFTENYWKQLISSMLEYSIINFKKHHNIASMTPEDILNVVESLKKDENLIEKKKINLNTANRSRSQSKDDNQRLKSNKLVKSISKDKQPLNNFVKINKNAVSTKSRESSANKKFRPTTPSKDNHSLQFTLANKNNNTKSKTKKSYNSNNSNTNINTMNINSINRKEKIMDSDTERTESRLENKKHIKQQSSGVINTLVKKNTEIMEIANLNKLKEKKLLLQQNNQNLQNKERENSQNNNTNAYNLPKKMENYNTSPLNNKKSFISDDESHKPISKNFNKSESKIKTVLDRDKKIHSMKSQQQNSIIMNSSSNNIEPLQQQEKKVIPIHSNYNQSEKFIGEGVKIYDKERILSLEDKINGLSQKLNKIDKMEKIDNPYSKYI